VNRHEKAQKEFLTYVRREAVDMPDIGVVDVPEPKLYREIFPWTTTPIMPIDNVEVPIDVPEKIWITDTTFRDGQQAREPYTTKQMVDLYSMLQRMGGPKQKISMSEFFLYTKRDVDAVKECLRHGGMPKVTAWIRAAKADVQLFSETSKAIKKDTGLELDETGILTSISDYHIFYKYGSKGRKDVVQGYLDLVEEVLKAGYACRCHLEDSTRSDVYGVVVPFVRQLMKLSERYDQPVVIRYPDTLGVGVPWSAAALPRSVPKLTYVLRNICDVPADWLEYHGQMDLNFGIANATSAWMFGAARNNCTLLGIGERAGNISLETMMFHYAGLKGTFDGMDTRVITEIVDYYEKELNYTTPEFQPITGKNFNITRAGIHADGVLKNVEMYLPFDTEKLLGIPPGVGITSYSGTAGIAFWLNAHYRLTGGHKIGKDDPRVQTLYTDIMKIFEEGRTTALSDKEMEKVVEQHFPDIAKN
jgi:isopropylmalate/homocitrate/citramalate synthase